MVRDLRVLNDRNLRSRERRRLKGFALRPGPHNSPPPSEQRGHYESQVDDSGEDGDAGQNAENTDVLPASIFKRCFRRQGSGFALERNQKKCGTAAADIVCCKDSKKTNNDPEPSRMSSDVSEAACQAQRTKF